MNEPRSGARDDVESDERRLRILLMTDKIPGHDNGYAMRVSNVLEGLRTAGSVHACLIDSSGYGTVWSGAQSPDITVVPAKNARPITKWLRFTRGLPNNIRYDNERELRARVLAAVGDQPWDAVWCSRARVHMLLESTELGPRIVDLDDLSDALLRSEIRDRSSRRGRIVTFPRNARDWLDARLWRGLHRRISASVDRVIVCSTADERRLGVDNCAVVPNGYPRPDPLPTRVGRRTSNRLLIVGPLTYEPNRLAVRWLVNDVLPRIRADVPDIALTVVGEHAGVSLRPLSAPGVTFVGHVPDVGPYYAATSIAVAPLHSGAGTRLKVIEAMARGVPLVSTTFGSYGHDLRPGHDLLVADDAETFAAACLELLSDELLYERLATNASHRFDRDLTSAATIEAVRHVVAQVVDGKTSGSTRAPT